MKTVGRFVVEPLVISLRTFICPSSPINRPTPLPPIICLSSVCLYFQLSLSTDLFSIFSIISSSLSLSISVLIYLFLLIHLSGCLTFHLSVCLSSLPISFYLSLSPLCLQALAPPSFRRIASKWGFIAKVQFRQHPNVLQQTS